MTQANGNTPCPEKQLLVCCARTSLAPEGVTRIRQLLVGQLDWDYLLWEAEENSITPLLARHLAAAAPGAVPPGAQEQLKKTCRANAVGSLSPPAKLITPRPLFQPKNIPAIPYKGPVLAAQAYRDIAL